ncbi:chaoptin [Neodiprion virginianus]|uniref:chaoptin n=1 Tax=Neodiprion virginianus TaxID=2961670 RepID=UPI001EE76FFE|nr:chaoptin [Neodiprion virginianus]
MNLGTFVKLGYIMLIVTLILMFWSAMVRMHEIQVQYPPCFFNPLCTCSKAIPDLGIVSCHNVPMPRIPQPINSSKVFILKLENNGLHFLQPQFLIHTGLYKLQIKHNLLSDIPDDAFVGLERSLWELELPYNHLIHVPSRSFRHLQRLRQLDLTGNRISEITPDNWRGLNTSLQTLRLGKNFIDRLPANAFSGLSALEVLDLHGNSLLEIDATVFKDGIDFLTHLYLNDNQLNNVPYAQLSTLKHLRYLDLSHNRISRMLNPQIENEIRGMQMSLDELRLDYNQINNLLPGAFQHFRRVNKTYLDGNPLTIIQEGAFKDSKMRELYLGDCDLMEVSSPVFMGLEPSLELLDLTGNNITELPVHLFRDFDYLRTFMFRENKVDALTQGEDFNDFQYSLYNLDLSGKKNRIISLQSLKEMRNLRFISLSRMPKSTLSPEDFLDFGMDLKELRIIQSNLDTIKNHAFKHVRGIKYLDFSENSISTIEDDAFAEVGHSLLTLQISHGLSSSVTNLPANPLKSLTNLQHLDFSNNRIQNMPETAFHFLKRIRRIDLQDNTIQSIQKGTFQGDIHSILDEINLAFNEIKFIGSNSFVDLPSLTFLNLQDNSIDKIERRAFINMNRLKYINLRGNKIKDITDEAFQNLPDLELMDLAYNQLHELDFMSFDQVGTLSSFKVNASYNKIQKLWINSTTFTPQTNIGGIIQSNIKVLDLSHNNISDIMRYYFRPVEFSLTHLYLSHNKLLNVTQHVFGNMPHLQWLDLNFNDLMDINFDCFKNTRNLQILLMAWNEITEIPVESFRSLKKLRIVDLSHNKLRALPDNLFTEGNLESLDLSHNQFMRLPMKSMSPSAAASLSKLDMSWNVLAGLHNTDAIFRFRDMTWLDLSYNRLVRLDDGVFSELAMLSYLDLSHNKEIILESHGKSFHGLEDTLLTLGLSNMSLYMVPELPLRRLRTLYLAHNKLSSIQSDMAANMTSLRHLDLSYNELSTVPLITHTLPELRSLNLAGNPITSITNTSFLGLADSLEELEIRRLPLDVFEAGALCKASKLRNLHITVFKKVKNFNLPNILNYNHGLRSLHVEVDHDINLEKEMRGTFPAKLYNMTLSGKALTTIHKDIFQGIRNSQLHFTLHNTSVKIVPRELFTNTGSVRNISIDFHNNHIGSIGNPSSGHKPGIPGKTFLTKIRLSGSHLNCDCEIGWIEMWQRKQRQYYEDECGTYTDHISEPDENDKYNCWDNGWDDDLRETFCLNKNNISLLEALKTDLECGWGSANAPILTNAVVVFSILMVNVF